MNKETHEAVTVAARYKEVNLKAEIATKAITELMHARFEGAITEEEVKLLYNAKAAIHEIAARTTEREAMNYLNNKWTGAELACILHDDERTHKLLTPQP